MTRGAMAFIRVDPGRYLAAGIVAFGSLLVAGCGTATIEDAVPRAAFAANPPALPEPPPAPVIAVTSDYPNLNLVPTPAAEQRTRAEARSLTTDLRSTRRDAQRDPGRPMADSVADMQRLARQQGEAWAGGDEAMDVEALRRLGQTHGEDALRRIEGR